MEKQAEIEFMGHKAKIGWIKGAQANPPFSIVDSLLVYIALEKPVDGTEGFGINIPVANYGKEQLTKTIIRVASDTLGQIVSESRKLAKKEDDRKRRQEELDSLGTQLLQMISK